MRISVFGLGYVGAVSLGCLARDGHTVIGVDVDDAKLDIIRSGKTPIIEDGMTELMRDAVASGRIEVTNDAVRAVHHSEISMICVGTPSRPNGSQDLSAIERLCKQLGQAIKTHSQYHLFVIRSTVSPGTVDGMVKPIMEENSGKRVGDDFDVCFQPEFLREGSSIKDYDNPPFTVVGTESPKAADMLQGVFGHLPCDFVTTSVRSAEMLKYTCNIFHAVKITFANEIGRLSQSMGVDSHAVMELVCQDKRLNISPAYMKPGFAFGGSCLPKDLKAMLHVAMRSDVATPMLSGILPSNQIHIDRAIDMVLSTGRRAVGLVGLSFKSGTDDLRESPLVLMAERFIGKGLDLQIYDPEVQLSRLIGANKRYIEETIPHIALLMSESCEEVVDRAEVVVVGLRDIAIMETLYARTRSEQLILDLVNIPRCEKLKGEYLGICW